MLTYRCCIFATDFFAYRLESLIQADCGEGRGEKSRKSRKKSGLKLLIYKDYLYFPTFLLFFCQKLKVIIFKKYFRPYK